MRTSSRHPRAAIASTGVRLALLGSLALVPAACRANYAPNSPITGIDRPYTDQPSTQAADAGPGLLASFMADVVAESELPDVDPTFAVFPALSAGRDVGVSVNGMGMYLAEQTTRLIENGVPNALVFSGDQLLGEMRRAGIAPEDLCSVDDILQVAPQLGVTYLISGQVDHTTENALEGQHSVSVRWSCLRLDDGRLAALVDEPAIRGEAAAQFIGYLARPTNWNVCGR